jgi:hypothetical protein
MSVTLIPNLARELQQSQRVTARLGHDPVADTIVKRRPDHGLKQGPCILVAQPSTTSSGSPDHCCPSSPERAAKTRPPIPLTVGGHERERLGRGLVELLMPMVMRRLALFRS